MFVVTRTDMVDYHRRYALDPLIKTKQQLQFIEILKNRVRATVEEACPECKHPQMEYYTMQLRSADEGQVGGCRRAARRAGWMEGVWMARGWAACHCWGSAPAPSSHNSPLACGACPLPPSFHPPRRLCFTSAATAAIATAQTTERCAAALPDVKHMTECSSIPPPTHPYMHLRHQAPHPALLLLTPSPI